MKTSTLKQEIYFHISSCKRCQKKYWVESEGEMMTPGGRMRKDGDTETKSSNSLTENLKMWSWRCWQVTLLLSSSYDVHLSTNRPKPWSIWLQQDTEQSNVMQDPLCVSAAETVRRCCCVGASRGKQVNLNIYIIITC